MFFKSKMKRKLLKMTQSTLHMWYPERVWEDMFVCAHECVCVCARACSACVRATVFVGRRVLSIVPRAQKGGVWSRLP